MKEYLKEENTGPVTDKCPICTINTYGEKETKVGNVLVKGEPLIWPCGVTGTILKENQSIGKAKGTQDPARHQCPFETKKEQENINPDVKRLIKAVKE